MFISVVMAVYNGEKYLKEAITSILSQTYHEFELIIVNDASFDKTRRILEKIRNERVRVFHLPENKGAAYALNYGVDHAKGDWVAIHDADDCSYPERLEEQVRYIKNADKGLVAVGSFIECMDEYGKPKRDIERSRNSLQRHEEITSTFYTGCPLTHGTMMFSKKVFYQAGKYNTQYQIAYDYDLWVRLMDFGRIENVPKVLYRYRRYNHSLSENSGKETSEELFSSFSRFLRKNNFPNHSSLPSFAVIGTKENTTSFRNSTRKHINVKKTLMLHDKNVMNMVKRMLNKGKIDGIVILYNDRRTKKLFKQKINDWKKTEKVNNVYLFWSGF